MFNVSPELSAEEIDPKLIEDIFFPIDVQPSEKTGSAQTLIPANLLIERGAEGGYNDFIEYSFCFSCQFYTLLLTLLDGNVSAVNILFTNLEVFLPQQDSLERYEG